MRDERNKRYRGLERHGNRFRFKKNGVPVKVPIEHSGSWADAYAWKKQFRGEVSLTASAVGKRRFLDFAVEVMTVRYLQLKESTRATYLKRLNSAWVQPLHALKMGDIGTTHIRQLVVQPMKNAGLSATMIRSTLDPIATVFSFALEDLYLEVNPVQGINWREMPKSKRKPIYVYSQEDIQRLLAACNSKYRPVIVVALYTGARISEILGLTWADVDFENRMIHFRHQRHRTGQLILGLKTEKDGDEMKGRPVEMAESLCAELLAHRRTGSLPVPTALVFPDVHHGGLTTYIAGGCGPDPRNVKKRIPYRGLRDRLGPPFDGSTGHAPFTLHKLRHNYTSQLHAQRIPLADISKQSGHTVETMVKTYTHGKSDGTIARTLDGLYGEGQA